MVIAGCDVFSADEKCQVGYLPESALKNVKNKTYHSIITEWIKSHTVETIHANPISSIHGLAYIDIPYKVTYTYKYMYIIIRYVIIL